MSVTIKKVESRSDLKKFVDFPIKLYKGNKCYVPAMYQDDIDTFTPKKSPVFAFSKASLFLAYKDGKVAGRVAAIINEKANAAWNHNEVRYGWFDFIDDKEVSKALIDNVIEFGRQNGMDTITGPLGFVDFDSEGMVVEGFDKIATMALKYNYPYYMKHMENMGFEKEVDWIEYNIKVPDALPDKYHKAAQIVGERYGLHTRKLSKKEIFGKEKYGEKIFGLINEAYSVLYNYTVLPKAVVEKYIKSYFSFLDFNLISAVEDKDGRLIGFGAAMPTITHALQKCDGKLFPFGWFHILKSMYWKHEDSFELLLIGVTQEYKNKGVHAMIFDQIMPYAKKCGFKFAETNAELETNHNIQTLWSDFETTPVKRRRVYKKSIL